MTLFIAETDATKRIGKMTNVSSLTVKLYVLRTTVSIRLVSYVKGYPNET